MTQLITDKKEIDNIIAQKIKGRKLVFTRHYNLGLTDRGIEHHRVKQILPQYEKVFAIEIDKLKLGDIGYELFYDLGNNITFSIAFVPKKEKVDVIHAIEYKRNLGKRLRQR